MLLVTDTEDLVLITENGLSISHGQISMIALKSCFLSCPDAQLSGFTKQTLVKMFVLLHSGFEFCPLPSGCFLNEIYFWSANPRQAVSSIRRSSPPHYFICLDTEIGNFKVFK